jgi:hypothetical protein
MMISRFIRAAKIIFLVSLAVLVTPAYSKNMPCNVKLEFDSNSKGSVANYVLSLQLKNTTGRGVSGASVIYMDENRKNLGNTLLYCSTDDNGMTETV